MSQLGSQVHLNASSVTNYFQAMQQRDMSVLENLKTCKEAIIEAAQLYEDVDAHDEAKLKQLREQLLSLVRTEDHVNSHKSALDHVRMSYQPALEKTNFEQLIQQHVEAAGVNPHPERDDDVQDFDRIAGIAGAAAEDDELGSDDELVVVGPAVEKNEKCPYTMKLLIDLDEPVEDQKGFVYEAAAVKQAIRNGRGATECPMAGASHMVLLATLKPCKRILRQQKQRQRQGGAGQGTQHPPAGPHGRVLDI